MADLREKLIKELPKGATIISSTFFIPEWTPEKVIEVDNLLYKTKIFIYKKR